MTYMSIIGESKAVDRLINSPPSKLGTCVDIRGIGYATVCTARKDLGVVLVPLKKYLGTSSFSLY